MDDAPQPAPPTIMKFSRPLLVPVLSAPLLLAAAVLGDSPTFAPDEGSQLTKRIVLTSNLALDEMTMTINGEDLPSEMTSMDMESSSTMVAVVTDQFTGVGEGRPTVLTRTYDELNSTSHTESSNPMAGDSSSDGSGASDLEGTTVVFTWDADDEEYTVAFGEDSDEDDDLLEGLFEDLDFRGVLPDGEVESGDSWDVDPNAISAIFSPGGDLKIMDPDAEGGGMGMQSGSPSAVGRFIDELEGDVTAKLTSVEDSDEGRIAVIEVTIDVSAAMDLTDVMSDAFGSADMPDGLELEVESFDVELLYEGTGELQWNLTTGLIYAFNVSGDIELINDVSMNMSMGGQSQAMEQSMSFAGTQTLALSTDG